MCETAEQSEPPAALWLMIGCPIEIVGCDGNRMQISIGSLTGWVDSAHVATALPEGCELPMVQMRTKDAMTVIMADGTTTCMPEGACPQLLGFLGGWIVLRYEGRIGLLDSPVGYSVRGGDALSPVAAGLAGARRPLPAHPAG